MKLPILTEEVNGERTYVNPPSVSGYKLKNVKTSSNKVNGAKGTITMFEYVYNKDPELKVDFGVSVAKDKEGISDKLYNSVQLDLVVYVDNKIVCNMGGSSDISNADKSISAVMNGLRDDFDDLYQAGKSVDELTSSLGSVASDLFKKSTQSAKVYR